MKPSEYIYLRPDISKYQVLTFRDQEQEAISKIANIKYCQNLSETFLAENKNLPIIFCSTSYTKIKDFSSIFNRIKLWLHPNSGYDNLDLSFVKNSTFPIIVGNEIRADAVYLYIIQCLLNFFGNIPFNSSWDPTREFKRINFYEKRILLIGLGNIGSKVSTFLQSSNMNYSIYDPFVENNNPLMVDNFKLEDYDIVILCCSLNKTSRHILNDDNLKDVSKPLCIINAARGELIEEKSLIAYKKRLPEAQVYLDVFEKEPCDFSIFSDIPNIYTSSHIAGVYNDIDSKIIEYEARIIESYLNLSFQEFELKYNQSELKKRIKKDILI